MKCAIHQPMYFPRINYFEMIRAADIFVLLDDVQFSNDNWQNYNSVKTPQGECRLKVPVLARFGQIINEVRINDRINWREKHLKTIRMNYARAEHYAEIYPLIEDLVKSRTDSLAAMNERIIRMIASELNIETKIIKSSQLRVDGHKQEKVLNICKAVGADEYLSGLGAASYQSEERFTDAGIKLTYKEIEIPAYKQLWGGFRENLSVIDYAFNNGLREKTNVS